jgi:hypothetical protein
MAMERERIRLGQGSGGQLNKASITKAKPHVRKLRL